MSATWSPTCSSRVRVVAVTADAFEDTRGACLAAGFDGWLAKPFRIEELARVLEGATLLRQRRSSLPPGAGGLATAHGVDD